MTRTALQNSTTLLSACLVGALAAGALGYATGGTEGGAVAAVGFALAVGVTAGLLRAVGAAVGRPDDVQVRPAAVGAAAVAGWAALAVAAPSPALPLWAVVGGVALVGGLLGAATGSPSSGLWHGTLACGAGGALTVYLSVYESFTMQPELTGVVLIGAVVAPLASGLVGGLGGGLGALAFGAVGGRPVVDR